MKFVLLAFFCFVPVFAFAAGEKERSAVVDRPVETIKLTDQITEGLFDRVRGAHLRAFQRGAIVLENKG